MPLNDEFLFCGRQLSIWTYPRNRRIHSLSFLFPYTRHIFLREPARSGECLDRCRHQDRSSFRDAAWGLPDGAVWVARLFRSLGEQHHAVANPLVGVDAARKGGDDGEGQPWMARAPWRSFRSEEHTSELQSLTN